MSRRSTTHIWGFISRCKGIRFRHMISKEEGGTYIRNFKIKILTTPPPKRNKKNPNPQSKAIKISNNRSNTCNRFSSLFSFNLTPLQASIKWSQTKNHRTARGDIISIKKSKRRITLKTVNELWYIRAGKAVWGDS